METMERSKRRDRRPYIPECKREVLERCRLAGGRDVAGPGAEPRRNELPIPLFPPIRTSPWGSVVT